MSPASPTPAASPAPAARPGPTTLAEFQRVIEATYGERDAARGVSGTFLWFVEEVGELARALKKKDPENLREEFGDVLAWLSTLASLAGVGLEDAAKAYMAGCPYCASIPCGCPARPAP